MENQHAPDTQHAMSAENQGPSAPERTGAWLVRNSLYLALIAALLGYLLYNFELDNLVAMAKAAFGLGLVVFIHELGHFLVAKWCDVHVETFSIGFGPALPGCSFRWGETTYMIGLFPLGGYVKMVGEGAEGDESDEDPRSFKNKPVWQRMAIISAGVTMNLILALACFVFVFRVHGDDQIPGVIDRIDPGGPAWKVQARTGDVIQWIGSRGPFPPFDQLQPIVMGSSKGEKLRFVFGPPGAAEQDMMHTEVQPRRHEGDQRPVIGISPPMQLRLLPADRLSKGHPYPYLAASVAAQAEPLFQCDDVIVATTDPDDPTKIKPLPPDPRNSKNLDYFEFQRRLILLAGKEMMIQVRRKDLSEPVTVRVPPAYYVTLGLRMRMGKVTALRNDSTAQAAGVQEGDIIDQVEVQDASGRIVRYGTFAGKAPPPDGVTQKSLDPLRLPSQLREWASQDKKGKTVTLALLRTNPPPVDFNPNNHQERQRVVAKANWDDSWKFNDEKPLKLYSSLSVPELGIAYRVETTIEAVDAGSPATTAKVEKPASIKLAKDDIITHLGQPVLAKEGEMVQLEEGDTINLKPADVIKSWQFQTLEEPSTNVGLLTRMARWLGWQVQPPEDQATTGKRRSKWIAVEPDQWAGVFAYSLQSAEVKTVFLRLDRDQLEVSLTARQDPSWPIADRGLLLREDRRLQKASSIGQALSMGFDKTYDFIGQIFSSIRGLATRQLSPDLFAGPFLIAKIAYELAGRNIFDFLLFLGMIGVNLAVINFMPIPVLDGGHMAFLVYEKLRGRPAPEGFRIIATYVGLLLIVCLMVAVLYFDVSRL